MLPIDPSAHQVSEKLLDQTGRALMSGDVSGFLDAFTFPFELETETGKRIFNEPSGIEDVFQAVHGHLKQMRVTILARHCVAAEFRTSRQIIATHETRLISDGLLIEEPFPTFSTLVMDKTDSWKIQTSSYCIPVDSLYRLAFDD